MMPDSNNALIAYPMTNQLKRYKDPCELLRAIYRLELFGAIHWEYRFTRYFEDGLATAEYFLAAIERNADKITAEEFKLWESDLIMLKLDMLDYLNAWPEYLAYFDSVKQTRYLYDPYHERYKVIARKYAKVQQGRSVNGLLRHQRDQLSPEDAQGRFNGIFERLETAAEYHAWLNRDR